MTWLSQLLLLCAVLDGAASSDALAAEITLYNAPETVVFSSGFKNAKIALVCNASTPEQD